MHANNSPLNICSHSMHHYYVHTKLNMEIKHEINSSEWFSPNRSLKCLLTSWNVMVNHTHYEFNKENCITIDFWYQKLQSFSTSLASSCRTSTNNIQSRRKKINVEKILHELYFFNFVHFIFRTTVADPKAKWRVHWYDILVYWFATYGD